MANKHGFLRRFALSAVAISVFGVGLPSEVFGGKIIRPWRATTAIVVDGSTFEIWYDADSGQTVNSIDLKSQHKTITNVPFSTESGSWEYDFHSGNTYDRIYTVTVPIDTPEDRYELILNTSTGTENSTGAVKVIQEYRDEYYIVGTGCAHRYQNYDSDGDGDSDDDDKVLILRKISEILKVCDILDVQLFFEAGDNFYSPGGRGAYYDSRYGRTSRSRQYEYFQGIEEENIWGIHDTSAATFMTAGNHEAPDNTANGEPASELAEYFNDEWGMYYHNTVYGNARYLNINNGWGGGQYDPSGQTQILRDELDNDLGRGNFIVGILHKKQEASTGPYNKINFDLSLVAHNHTDAGQNPRQIPLDSNQTIWSPAIQYVADSNKDRTRLELNLFRINNANGTYTTPSGSTARMQIIEGTVSSKMGDDPSTWVRKLELNYASNNNGSVSTNTGTITSRHNFLIEDAKIRFVMAPGAEYEVDNGTIRQQFTADNGDVIVDVAVDVPANTNVSVEITEAVVAPNNALYVSDTIPTVMDQGETVSVSVTMKNTGLDTWSTDLNGHKLGIPEDYKEGWSPNRVELGGNTVAPEAEYTFTFDLTAPTTRGLYDFQMQMVDDIQPNQEWFGSPSPLIQIQVGPADIHIEAELFVETGGVEANTDGSFGFIAQSTSDTGGGDNLGFTRVGDYATYDVEITHAGTYYLQSRIASPSAGANFQLKEGDTVLTTVSTASTGGFQTWQTFSNTVTLTEGQKTFTMLATGSSWNINWLKLIPADGLAPQFTSTPGQFVEVAQAYSYTATAQDANGDAFSFSAVSLPGWLSLNGAVLSGTPAAGDVGDNHVVLRVTDAGGLASDQTFSITVRPIPQEGDEVLAVDFQNAEGDFTESGFTGWAIGNRDSSTAAATTVIDGYSLSFGAGSSVACLTDPAQQTGMNARNRSDRYILDSGSFTQDDMMRERMASSGSPTNPATGKGIGTGLYLKISGLSPNTNYRIQSWGVDFNAGPSRLKNGYVYGFDATSETAGYSSLREIGTYTVTGEPTTIADNDAYSVSGNIMSDSSGTIIYKQISDIDNSVMNGFKLFVGPPLAGFDAWAVQTGAGSELEDPDGDGRVNLLEYALGGDPKGDQGGETGMNPVITMLNGTLEFKHMARSGDPSLTYTVQSRESLTTGDWTDLVTTPATGSADGDYVEMMHDIAEEDMSDTQLFLRLKVERQ